MQRGGGKGLRRIYDCLSLIAEIFSLESKSFRTTESTENTEKKRFRYDLCPVFSVFSVVKEKKSLAMRSQNVRLVY